MTNSVMGLLSRTEVFGWLPEPQLQQVARAFRERRVDRDQLLFRQGDAADALYVVVTGRIRISAIDQVGRQRVLAFAGVGEVVGEMGLLGGEPRSATAVATTDSKLLQLRKADFDSLLANNIDLMRHLARVVGRRREVTQQRALDEAGVGEAYRPGLVTALFSPRGGAGTTTIATNLAVALAQRMPDRVAVLDLNVPFGHVPLFLNLTPRTSLAAMSAVSLRQMDRENLEFYLTTHTESSLRVLSAVLRPDEAELVTAEHVIAAVDLLRRHFVHVVVDLARGFSELNLSAFEAASNIVLVCTPDRAGVRGIAQSQRILRQLLRLPIDPLQYILNQRSPYTPIADDQLEHTLNLPLAATIPFDGDTPARAALEGQPLVTRWPTSAMSKSLLSLARTVEQQLTESRALMPAPVAAAVAS